MPSANGDAGAVTLEMARGALFSAVVSDALDALSLRGQSPAVTLLPLTTDAVLIGRARTTLWADVEDDDEPPYAKELAAVDACLPDEVFVAAAGGSLRSAVWGELLSTAARSRGCAGAVVDGAVRDVRSMRAMGFPVFARGTCARDSRFRQKVVACDVPVVIGGTCFRPGDLVVADPDGVVVVPRQVEEEVLRRAWSKVIEEHALRRTIERGMTASEAYRRYGVL
jgi:4-hydroxy-4-methyl-2-oxoglutarate aldolase